MDGQYGAIVFVATQTDALAPFEVSAPMQPPR